MHQYKVITPFTALLQALVHTYHYNVVMISNKYNIVNWYH